MATAPERMTLEQFLRLPEAKPALEFHDGVVSQKMSPKGPHGSLQGRFFWLFESAGPTPHLARAFPETRITLSGSSYVPDVIAYRWERVPADEHGNVPDDFTVPPDIVVEIASPGQSLQELANRCRWYVNQGVRVELLTNDRNRSVRVFRPGPRESTYSGAARIDLSDGLPGLVLDLVELFGWLRARPE